jgi:predicted NACHT family NTPase
MSSVSAQYALTKSDPFLEGDWHEGERSLYCSSRIEVDIWESLLTISSTTLRSDVTIRISQNDETMKFLPTRPAGHQK